VVVAAPIETNGLASVDLVLKLIELLAAAPRPRGVSDIARALGISKPRAHRHLRTLVEHGYVRQDAETERYEIGIKLLGLGETVRDRFDILGVARPEMMKLREETGHAVTLSALVEGATTVLELVQGKTLIEFGIKPGSTFDFHTSAHGLVALAFGPPSLLEQTLGRPLRAWTGFTITDPARLTAEVEAVRQRGWATAADQILVGVNTLACPIFDHRNDWRGTIAIVGSSQFIEAQPTERQIAQVSEAAAAASRQLGWRTAQR
jgi:DNA-binding IclR family transcriptional regulator